jgi:hypothetical protein
VRELAHEEPGCKLPKVLPPGEVVCQASNDGHPAEDMGGMCADFLRHMIMLQEGPAPFLLHKDYYKLVDIAQLRKRAAKLTYRQFRDSELPDDPIIVQIIRLHMKACVKQYYKCLPQLDMLALHHNIPLQDGSQVDDLASLRSDSARDRRAARLDDDIRDQMQNPATQAPAQHQATLASLQRKYDVQSRAIDHRDDELSRLRQTNRSETDRRRTTDTAFNGVTEELRVARTTITQLQSQTVSDNRPRQDQIKNNHMRDSMRFPRPTLPRNSLQQVHLAPDFNMQFLQCLKAVTAAAGGGRGPTVLADVYPTMQEYYDGLTSPWNKQMPIYGPIKELYKIRNDGQEKFAAWRTTFHATVHTQRMNVLDKALALSATLDSKEENLSSMLKALNYDGAIYATIIKELERLYGGAEAEVTMQWRLLTCSRKRRST